MKKPIHKMIAAYKFAKEAARGATVPCPYCSRPFVKSTYDKTFCCNAKTSGRRNCKDMFWNAVDPEKRCRKTPYFYDVVLEKYARERGFPSYADMTDPSNGDFNLDPAHGSGPIELSICTICGLRSDYCQCGIDCDGASI